VRRVPAEPTGSRLLDQTDMLPRGRLMSVVGGRVETAAAARGCVRGGQGADRRQRLSRNRSGETAGCGLDGLRAREAVRRSQDAAA
jgi:hypothetical protein